MFREYVFSQRRIKYWRQLQSERSNCTNVCKQKFESHRLGSLSCYRSDLLNALLLSLFVYFKWRLRTMVTNFKKSVRIYSWIKRITFIQGRKNHTYMNEKPTILLCNLTIEVPKFTLNNRSTSSFFSLGVFKCLLKLPPKLYTFINTSIILIFLHTMK